MHQGHQVPQYSKQEPGPSKGGRKEEELVAPLHVQESRPEVAEVQRPSAAHMLDAHVASSVFGEDAPPPAQSTGPSVFCSCSTCACTSRAPRGAQQGLGNVSLRLGVANLLRGGAFRGRGSGRSHDCSYTGDGKRRRQGVRRQDETKGCKVK